MIVILCSWKERFSLSKTNSKTVSFALRNVYQSTLAITRRVYNWPTFCSHRISLTVQWSIFNIPLNWNQIWLLPNLVWLKSSPAFQGLKHLSTHKRLKGFIKMSLIRIQNTFKLLRTLVSSTCNRRGSMKPLKFLENHNQLTLNNSWQTIPLVNSLKGRATMTRQYNTIKTQRESIKLTPVFTTHWLGVMNKSRSSLRPLTATLSHWKWMMVRLKPTITLLIFITDRVKITSIRL